MQTQKETDFQVLRVLLNQPTTHRKSGWWHRGQSLFTLTNTGPSDQNNTTATTTNLTKTNQ